MIMNKAQVDELFHREAVLLGREEEVPEFRVVELFGQAAVTHLMHFEGSFGGYGIGDFTLHAVTYAGFRRAASFHNVEQLRSEAEAAHAENKR